VQRWRSRREEIFSLTRESTHPIPFARFIRLLRLLSLSHPFDRYLLPEAAGNLLGKQSFSQPPIPVAPIAIRRFLALLRLVKLGSVPARANQPVHPPSHGILIFREVTAVPFLFPSLLLPR